MSPNPRAAWAALLLVAAFSGTATAASIQPLTPAEMAWIADLVARAEVVDQSVERVPGQEWLRTVTTLVLLEVEKGELAEGERVPVLTLGGRLGGEETRVDGVPRFEVGERVLVFLSQKADGWGVVGWQQGKFRVEEDAVTGRELLAQPLGHVDADELLGGLRRDLRAGAVPPFQVVAGMDEAKLRAWFRAAERAGRAPDPRWREHPAVKRALAAEGAAP